MSAATNGQTLFLAFLSCICESSIEDTILNEACKDRFISRVYSNFQCNVLTFLEVASFHARKLPATILFKHLNFYSIILKIYFLTKY